LKFEEFESIGFIGKIYKFIKLEFVDEKENKAIKRFLNYQSANQKYF